MLQHWGNKLLGKNYSLPGDLHCYTDGNNLKTGKGLVVSVKKEKTKGMIWKSDAGFVPGEFNYTAGILSTGESFWQKEGIFEAKVKFRPVKEVASSITLSGENNQNYISLLEQGTKNRMGILSHESGKKIAFRGMDINNLNGGKSYLFRLQLEKNQLTWSLNEKELLSIPAGEINYPLHLNVSSVVVYDVPDSQLPVNFEIDWIRCYRKKQN